MEAVSYPTCLSPDDKEKMSADGRDVEVPAVNLVFNTPKDQSMRHTWRKTPVEYRGMPMFAELAIVAKVVETQGWSARWVARSGSFDKGPHFIDSWKDAPLKQQIRRTVDSEYHLKLLSDIARNNGRSYSGCWDVLAWNGERTLFIESKRNGKDRIRGTQEKWLSAALTAGRGLTLDNFLVVKWRLSS